VVVRLALVPAVASGLLFLNIALALYKPVRRIRAVAIFSSEQANSLNVRKPLNIKSRTMRSDQASPNISSAMLMGHPERWEEARDFVAMGRR
jgi:hypothetical protein